MQKLAKTLLNHEPLLLNWFDSQGLSSGVVEGFNNKAKLTMRKAYGFKEFETIEVAFVPSTCEATRAKFSPQILLTRQIFG